MKAKLLALLMMASFSISCTSVPANVTLQIPPDIQYPKITLEEVECLPKSIKEKIKKRDRLKSQRIETLKNIIKSTH